MTKESEARNAPQNKAESVSTPLVSIVIPTHNRAATLRRAVVSSLEQTYPAIEVSSPTTHPPMARSNDLRPRKQISV